MPIIYDGEYIKNGKEYKVKAIFGKDIKINLYRQVGKIEDNIQDMLNMGADFLKNLTSQRQKYELYSSYVNIVVSDKKKKLYHREIYRFGPEEEVQEILDLYGQKYLDSEQTSFNTYPTHKGNMVDVTYYKELTKSTITSSVTELNGILQRMSVDSDRPEGKVSLFLQTTDKSSKVSITENVNYRRHQFDVGDIRDNAINAQVRSIRHLKTLKNLDWIEELIEKGNFKIIDKLSDLIAIVKQIQMDLMAISERKLYYDTEGSGLKVFNLPVDHPDADILSTHVISWVRKRRDDGYPLDVQTIAIPVGMKYCENIDEIEAIEALRPLLTNKNIGVVSHNSDYEKQICLRYSEVEGNLSYRKYHQWKKQLNQDSGYIDREHIAEQLRQKQEQLEEMKSTLPSVSFRLRSASLRNEIELLSRKLDTEAEIERVRNLPRDQKPYLSDIKGENYFRVNVKYDTLVLSRMVNNGGLNKKGEPFLRHALDVLTENYLGLQQLSLDNIYGNKVSSDLKIYDFSLLPREFMLYYACPDTHVMPFIEWCLERQAYEHMLALKADENQAVKANLELLNLYYNVDVPFALHMAEFANYKGIAIDKEKLDNDRLKMSEGVSILENFLQEITGETEIQWSSVKQVGPIVFSKFRYPIVDKTKEGNPSYNKKARKFHMNQTKEKFEPQYAQVIDVPILEKDIVDSEETVLIKASEFNKLKCPISFVYQAYMDRFKDLTSFTQMIYDRIYLIDDEWIYFPSYISTSTDTGRASGGTMIMKASKKSTFVARENHVLSGGDLDQAELRLISTMSQDLPDIISFKDPRYDPHTKTAAQCNNVDWEAVTKTMRDGAKVINFGYFYGMHAKATAQNIYKDLLVIPESLIIKTNILLTEFARANATKVAWLNGIRNFVKHHGFSKTPAGRYKFFPEIRKEGVENWELERAGRQGGNLPIQGFCADFIKERLVEVFDVVKECNISRFFTQPLFIHDEFHSEINKSAFIYASNEVYSNERVKQEQQFPLMWWYNLVYSTFTEKPLGLSYLEEEAPMTMGIGLGTNWADTKSDLHGCPQELQIKLISDYRQGKISDELHNSIKENPVKAMLREIRTWWAQQTLSEVEKVADPNHLPKNIFNLVEDLFVKRSLKDIFPVDEEELTAIGLNPKDDFQLGVISKALSYLKGEDVIIHDILTDDRIELEQNEELVEDILESVVIDLQQFRDMKNRIKEDYADEDFVFRESYYLDLDRVIPYESQKILELNIHGLEGKTVVNLETLIARMDSTKGVYSVVVVRREEDSAYNYQTHPTTYKVNVCEDLLIAIRNILEQDECYISSIRKVR